MHIYDSNCINIRVFRSLINPCLEFSLESSGILAIEGLPLGISAGDLSMLEETYGDFLTNWVESDLSIFGGWPLPLAPQWSSGMRKSAIIGHNFIFLVVKISEK